jgi:hypothetical protein
MEPTYKFRGQKVEVLEKTDTLWKIKSEQEHEFWVKRDKIKIKLPPKPRTKKVKEPALVDAVAV